MTNLAEEKINQYYGSFLNGLKQVGLTQENIDNIVSILGEENIKRAPGGANQEYGLAFDGGLLKFILTDIVKYCKIFSTKVFTPTEDNKLVADISVDLNSLLKVCLLQHISKAVMFTPNTDEWERNKRGIMYKFNKLDGNLRTGERTAFVLMKSGVELTEEEYEAICIIDKDKTNDDMVKYFSSPLAVIVRQINELANLDLKLKTQK